MRDERDAEAGLEPAAPAGSGLPQSSGSRLLGPIVRIPGALVRRLRDVVVCAALTVLAFVQSPGLIVADSKIDLAVNPVQWLGRSLHLWDPDGAFGQLQNQAYGYLWPMGPFFAAGTGIGLPAWVVQRLWWALLLCVAYTGAVRLAERLNIGTPASRLIAGLVFALSPRILTQLGLVSVETWPTALAPWVLVPLVAVARGGSLRRGVTLSALVVACAGGVNATAVFAVVPLGFLWLSTITPVRRRVLALVAWCGALLGATAWWIVPLLVLGRYSPPFLDYIETAATTTGVTDPVTALRGANHWVGFLEDTYEPAFPAGHQIAWDPVIIVATIALAALGLTGLARRGMPHRSFLATGLLLGFALVGLGHVGELAGTMAQAQQEFLDGIGSPLRNTHKFDVLMRLPLALGTAHLLGILLRAPAIRPTGPRRLRPGLGALTTAGTAVLLAAVAVQAAAAGLGAANGFAAVPGYWREATGWLNNRGDEGRVLVLPGSRFANYTWGDTLDEITQPLLTGPWAVRNVIPLSPPTTIRMMDTIESALATGYGSPALADYLARAGVEYVLVRNDLNYGRARTTAPLLVHQALDRSPGLEPVATFGPDVEIPTEDGARDGLGLRVPALQVLRVDRAVSEVVAYPAADVPTVVGGPESLLWLAEAGLLPQGLTILAGDLAGSTGTGPVLVTDGLRLRDRNFGVARDPSSATLNDFWAPYVRDYLPAWGTGWSTTAEYLGVEGLNASSSWGDKTSGGSRPEHQPFAAFDGDPATWWAPTPAPFPEREGEWLEVTLAQAQRVPEVIVHFAQTGGAMPTRVTVDTGVERATVDVSGTTLVVPLAGSHSVRRVRVSIDRYVETAKDGIFGITELQVPGVSAERTLVVPAPPAGTEPAAVLLTADPGVPACFFGPSYLDSGVSCAQRVARFPEDGTTIDRTVSLAAASAYVPAVWARPRAGAALDALLDELASAEVSVAASSRAFDEPAARPGAVLDGDLRTTWWAAADDAAPQLRFIWPSEQTVTGLRLRLAEGSAGTPVAAVAVVAGDEEFTAVLDDGELIFDAPLRTSELALRLLAGAAATSLDPYEYKFSSLPVAVSEVTLLTAAPTAAPARDLDATVDLPCGSGPTLAVGGDTVATRLTATVRDLVERRAVPAVPCSDSSAITIGAGTTRVIAFPSEVAVASRVALVPPSWHAARPSPAAVHIDQWSATRRSVTVDPHEQDLILAVRENTNPGWVARLGGVELTPIVVDGWQQGWVVPADLHGQVELTFAPDTSYQAGLFGGAVLLLAVVVLAAVPPRRRAGAPNQVPLRLGTRSMIILPLVVGGAGLVLVGGVLGGVVVAAGIAAVVLLAMPREGGGDRGGMAARSGLRADLRRWVGLAQWLLPAVILLTGAPLWFVVFKPDRNWITQAVGLLAVAAFWLSIVVTSPVARRSLRPGGHS